MNGTSSSLEVKLGYKCKKSIREPLFKARHHLPLQACASTTLQQLELGPGSNLPPADRVCRPSVPGISLAACRERATHTRGMRTKGMQSLLLISGAPKDSKLHASQERDDVHNRDHKMNFSLQSPGLKSCLYCRKLQANLSLPLCCCTTPSATLGRPILKDCFKAGVGNLWPS